MNVTNLDKCTGCSLCVISCPVNAISSVIRPCAAFWYPEIDETKCIKCNRCASVCPQNNTKIRKYESTTLVAQSTDIETLKSTTSGGVASALAKSFVQNGGVVYGAAFDSSMSLSHIRCISENDCEKIKGSKYVQSDILGVYEQIARDLNLGSAVLFFGTPCQCAGVKEAFDKYSNLYCCDFICNGVGSPVVFEKHIGYLEHVHRCKIVNYNFRPKKYNYLEPYELITDKNGKEYHNKSPWKKWGSIYYSGLSVRPSCYECKFIKTEARVSDITLSDIPNEVCGAVDPPFNISRYGCSLINIHNSKGFRLLEWAESSLYTKKVNCAMNDSNKHTKQSPKIRDDFLVEASNSLEKAKVKHLGVTLKIKGFIIEILDNISKKRG